MTPDDLTFDADPLDDVLRSALSARPEPVLAADFATRVVRTASRDQARGRNRRATLASALAALAMAVVVAIGAVRMLAVLPTHQSTESASHAVDPYTPLLLVAIAAVAGVLAYLAIAEADAQTT